MFLKDLETAVLVDFCHKHAVVYFAYTFSYLNAFPFKKVFAHLLPLTFHCVLIDEALTHPDTRLLLFRLTSL